jgi:AraC-like DNA-binding protein
VKGCYYTQCIRNSSGADNAYPEACRTYCDVSRFHLAHAFGKSTGLSVTEYLRCRRLTQAAYALAAGANDILSVALDSGYASHEASRAFKAQFGEKVRDREKAARNSSTHTIAATSARSSIVDRTSGHTGSPMVHCRAFRRRSCRALPL